MMGVVFYRTEPATISPPEVPRTNMNKWKEDYVEFTL
jgi:hypothetical protein